MNRNKIVAIAVVVVVIVAVAACIIFVRMYKPRPWYDRPVTYPATMPQSIRSDLANKIAASITAINQNSNDFNDYYDLGIDYKALGDYEGARLLWEYGAKIRPDDFLPRLALGGLYGYFLRDQLKAEFYYKDAIAKDPKQPFSYFQFASYYLDIIQDKTKALAVVNQGLAAIPGNTDLLALKKSITISH